MFTPITARLARRRSFASRRAAASAPCVVEAHPVDHGAVGDEPEQPRPRVAVLRDRRDRAHLDVPEPERVQPLRAADVLVEARPRRRTASRRSARAPRSAAAGAGRVSARAAHENGGTPSSADHDHRRVVRGLGVHAREDGPEEEGIHLLQAIGSRGSALPDSRGLRRLSRRRRRGRRAAARSRTRSPRASRTPGRRSRTAGRRPRRARAAGRGSPDRSRSCRPATTPV